MPQTSKSNRGQAMAEFVVVASVLAFLILGVIQFALIYQAKTTPNYAAFETARAGSVNNARMWAMELAFARAMAPIYTTPYVQMDAAGNCASVFTSTAWTTSSAPVAYDTSLGLNHVLCARQRVSNMISGVATGTAGQFVRILLVNPSASSFTDHGVTVNGVRYIPNDSLMYRDATPDSLSQQSIQDANLIKVHVSFCYELIVPLVNRMISRMITDAPTAQFPENFGQPNANSFSATCSVNGAAATPPRYGIPIHSESVMRMQSDAIRDTFCAGACP